MHKIGNEYDLIDYMYKNKDEYFDFQILATEVVFNNSLKAVDMVGFDDYCYYAIEFKKENISLEDFYNLEYIIKNNKYDKPIKGLLVGTKITENLLNLIEDKEYIDYLIPNDIEYDKNIEHTNKKKYNLQFNVMGNIFKKFFENSCGGNIKDILYNQNNETIIVKYYLKNAIKVYVEYSNEGCKLAAFKRHDISYNWYLIKECNTCYCGKIEDEIFNLENRYYVEIIARNNTFLKENIKSFSFLNLIVKYCSMRALAIKMKNNKLIIDDNTGIGLILDKRKRCVIAPLTYMDMLQYKIKDNHIPNITEYNLITILESTRVIINNKLYKPLVRVKYDKSYINLEISIRIGNNKRICKSYVKNRLANVLNYKFYLISDINIILNFEMFVKSYLNNKTYICNKYYDRANQFLYDKLKNNQRSKSIKDLINDYNFEEKITMNNIKKYYKNH